MNIGSGLSLEIGNYQEQVNNRIKQLEDQNFVHRLWNREESLWREGNPEFEMSTIPLGWLHVVDKMIEAVPSIEEFCKTITLSGFDHVVLLGMGGSSLAPLVFQKTLLHNKSLGMEKDSSQSIKFLVLDSTDPGAIKRIENEINISTTLFIVSSKSGTTIEVTAFFNYFFSKVHGIKRERAGENFIAITDEDSPLVKIANRKKFRKIFINFGDIGGRYSALSYFGIVPAALMGVNIRELFERAQTMINACGPQVPVSQNPGVALGVAIAELALKGCDKLTYILPPDIKAFGLWLEQLLAESTGKNGKGILPFSCDPSLEMEAYGEDRFFVQLKFSEEQDTKQFSKPLDSISLKHPMINILLKDVLDLGQEFFRWEIATATVGAILGVNPFDQPNVEESKKGTYKLLKSIGEEGRLPKMEASLIEDPLHYYAAQEAENGTSIMEFFFVSIKPQDYIALQAYLPEEPEVNENILQIKQYLEKSLHVPVTTEFGPRYLHSTGQYHKGGPNNGIFIQLICSSLDDIKIPGYAYTFGLLKMAQAAGDREALLKSKRRVILIDLGDDLIKGLDSFKQVVKKVQPVLVNDREIKEQLTKPLALLSRNYRANVAVAEQLNLQS